MSKDKIYSKFRPNVYMKPDAYLNGWASKCGWKATIVYDSLWRHADKFGNSFPSIQLMAEEHGVSYNTIRRGLKTLIEYNLVKKEAKRSKKGRFLHNTYTLTNKNEWKDISIAPTGLRSSIAPTGNIHSPHRAIKDTHNKDTHNNKKKNIIKRKRKYSSIKEITEEDLIEIANRYKVSVGFVSLQLEKLKNYCSSSGRRYKNYKSALRNFVLGDLQRRAERQYPDDNKRGIDARNVE